MKQFKEFITEMTDTSVIADVVSGFKNSNIDYKSMEYEELYELLLKSFNKKEASRIANTIIKGK